MPGLKPWRALGVDIPDRRTVVEPVRQRSSVCRTRARSALGKAAYAAYQDGAVTLEQFARRRRSDAWGDTLQAASLEALVGRELAQKYIRAVREALRKRKSSAGAVDS